jgi:cation:H+ antiporter
VIVIVLAVVGGLALLAVAPDRFVAGSAALADRWGLPRVVIGAVVIGFGTSAPELLVSGLAAADGEPEVGVGNIIGSNMANLGLVVAVAALVGHLAVPTGLLRRELPLMLGATAAFALAVQGGLTRVEGVLLAVGLVAALAVIIGGPGSRTGSAEAGSAQAELAVEVEELLTDEEAQGGRRLVVDVIVGLTGTLAGAQLLVTGAVEIASELDLSAGFVGMTVVALGTSLPELVTAVAAARAGEDQLILGNVLGSNLFNCLAVGALVGLAGPSRIDDPSVTVSAVALMLVITALAAVAMTRRQLVTRVEAALLMAFYFVLMPTLAT